MRRQLRLAALTVRQLCTTVNVRSTVVFVVVMLLCSLMYVSHRYMDAAAHPSLLSVVADDAMSAGAKRDKTILLQSKPNRIDATSSTVLATTMERIKFAAGSDEWSGITTTELTTTKPSPPSPAALASPLPPLRAVVMFLSGGRWDKYFTDHCLPRFDRYFMQHYPHYPVRVFHENLDAAAKRRIVAALPLAQKRRAASSLGAANDGGGAVAFATDIDHATQWARAEKVELLMRALGLGLDPTADSVERGPQQRSRSAADPGAEAKPHLDALLKWIDANIPSSGPSSRATPLGHPRNSGENTAPPNGGVEFHNVAQFWQALPTGVTEDELSKWMKSGTQARFQGRGYRLMCRFWAGLAWQLFYSDHVDHLYALLAQAATQTDPIINEDSPHAESKLLKPSAMRSVIGSLALYDRVVAPRAGGGGVNAIRRLADALSFGGRRALGGPLVGSGTSGGGEIFLQYDYYWRLDTDSIITRKVPIDPFQLVFGSAANPSEDASPASSLRSGGGTGCIYAFNKLKGENPFVTEHLHDQFSRFLQSEAVRAVNAVSDDVLRALYERTAGAGGGEGVGALDVRGNLARRSDIVAAVDKTQRLVTNRAFAMNPRLYVQLEVMDRSSSVAQSLAAKAGGGGADASDQSFLPLAAVRVARPTAVAAALAGAAPGVNGDGAGRPEGFWGPMFYNNFEMGTLAHKNAPLYRRWFTTVDTDNVTRGILRYRWGDAPLHTLGLFAQENGDTGRLCNVSLDLVAYRHGVKKPGPIQ